MKKIEIVKELDLEDVVDILSLETQNQFSYKKERDDFMINENIQIGTLLDGRYETRDYSFFIPAIAKWSR